MTSSFLDDTTLRKAVNPCRQELGSPEINTNRFSGSHSIKTSVKDNSDVIIPSVCDFVKHCSSLSGKAMGKKFGKQD